MITHEIVATVSAQSPDGTNRNLLLVRCSCGQEATMYGWQLTGWLGWHREEPDLSPAELATKHRVDGRHPPTFVPPSEELPSNVTHLSSGIEGGFCGSIAPHGSHGDCDGA